MKQLSILQKRQTLDFQRVLDVKCLQRSAIQTALLPVYDVKGGHFERAKMTLKMLPAS